MGTPNHPMGTPMDPPTGAGGQATKCPMCRRPALARRQDKAGKKGRKGYGGVSRVKMEYDYYDMNI